MNIREEFLSNYMVHLKGALPRELCEDWVQDYFVRTGIDESDPSTRGGFAGLPYYWPALVQRRFQPAKRRRSSLNKESTRSIIAW